MEKELTTISPLLLNTIGGLVALLFVVMIINAITKLIRSYRPVPVTAGNGSSQDLFAKSVRFNLHAQEQGLMCTKLNEVEKKIIEFDQHLSQLVAIGERQAEALERLVELRSEIVKAELIHAGKG